MSTVHRGSVAVRVGTSGWSYEDWDGHVYPKTLPAAERLHWYAQRFSTVEVDSTYYRDPSPDVVKGWVSKTADVKDFELSVKAPKVLTHELLVEGALDAIEERATAWRALVADPLRKAARLGAVLLQLSPAVVRHADALRRLDAALSALRGLPTAVEFRHRTWHDETPTIVPEALAILDAHAAAAVVVDGPPFPTIVAGSARHAFVRYHGRNAERWNKPERYYGDRYDHLYTEEELAASAPLLSALAEEKDVVRVYFNNHVGGKAFRNGETMEAMLERQGAPVIRAHSPQKRLPF